MSDVKHGTTKPQSTYFADELQGIPPVEDVGAQLGVSCAACLFCVAQRIDPVSIQRTLVCRALPPQVSMTPVTDGHGRQGLSANVSFPLVTPDTWCFRFQPRAAHNKPPSN